MYDKKDVLISELLLVAITARFYSKNRNKDNHTIPSTKMIELDAKLALCATIGANVLVFYTQQRADDGDLFSVLNCSPRAMLLSLFHHQDEAHLMSNMVALALYGWPVFCQTNDRVWTSPWAFLVSYAGSGLASLGGIWAVSRHHQRRWYQELQQTRSAVGCTSRWCQRLVDGYKYLTKADQVAGLTVYNAVPRMGASGAVFGILGAMAYTTLLTNSPHHARMQPYQSAMLLLQVAQEVALAQKSTSSLQLSKFLFDADNVDHVAHVAGFVSGVGIAAFLQWWTSTGRAWWKALCEDAGRRLGGGCRHRRDW